MTYLILGVALLSGLILAGQWFVSANPRTIIKVSKWVLIGTIVGVALFFVVTGRLAWAFWALPALLPWLLRARGMARMAKNFSRMSSPGGDGQTSEVQSRYLSMTLDHDTGSMQGYIREGRFEGRPLDRLSLAELRELHAFYRSDDSESARLLAAYMDRQFPEWRDQTDEGSADQAAQGAFSETAMTRDEALRILGVDDDASEEEITAAYHRLISNLHPDKGGSVYLSAKINQARDVLLNS